MAGLAGVFMRRGEPADIAAVVRMAAAASHRSPDGIWVWRDGPFAAIRQRTICTPEDEFEHGPVTSDWDGAAMVFEGRLDNRSDLALSLGIQSSELGQLSDASLALRAWLRWGEDTPVHLLGDFAFVAWDRMARNVFCATDSLGIRPLHYYLSSDILVFATEIRQLLEHPQVPRRPDERAVGAYLCAQPRADGRTLYEDVRRLPHAHSLDVTERAQRLRRYWRPDGELSTFSNVGGPKEYAEVFRHEFDRAVRACLRSRGPVGAHLSGGLDSSAVVATARAVEPNREVVAFSLLFPGWPNADERTYIDAMLRHVRVPAVQIAAPAFELEDAREQAQKRRYLPDFPHARPWSALRREMAARGIRVSLTGSGGDIGLTGSLVHYADLLRTGRLVSFIRRYVDVARSEDHGWTDAGLLRCALWPLLPFGVRRALRPIARRTAGLRVPDWIEPSFAGRCGLSHVPPLGSAPAGRLVATTIASSYDNGLAHLAQDLYELGSSEYAIYDRHPFLDRRLIEMLISLPDEERWSKGQKKSVLRRAMNRRLPDVVRQRSDQSKADFSHLFTEALAAFARTGFFRNTRLVRLGWVKPGTLPTMYERMHHLCGQRDSRQSDIAWQLWAAAAVEIWLSTVFETPVSEGSPWNNKSLTRPVTTNVNLTAELENRIASPS